MKTDEKKNPTHRITPGGKQQRSKKHSSRTPPVLQQTNNTETFTFRTSHHCTKLISSCSFGLFHTGNSVVLKYKPFTYSAKEPFLFLRFKSLISFKDEPRAMQPITSASCCNKVLHISCHFNDHKIRALNKDEVSLLAGYVYQALTKRHTELPIPWGLTSTRAGDL